MAPTDDRASIYHDIGVKPIINAFGTNTRYGGSKLRPEAMEAMNKAATVMVEIDELNKAAGRVIAKITGAEAGFVWINEVGRHFLGAPFGGYKQSGLGREEGIGELISFTQEKNIHINLGGQ